MLSFVKSTVFRKTNDVQSSRSLAAQNWIVSEPSSGIARITPKRMQIVGLTTISRCNGFTGSSSGLVPYGKRKRSLRV